MQFIERSLFALVLCFSLESRADLYTKIYQKVMESQGVRATPRSTIKTISPDVARFYGLPENMAFVLKWWEYSLVDEGVARTKPVHAYFHGWHSTPASFSPKKIKMRLLGGRPQIAMAQIGHGLGQESPETTEGFRSYALMDGQRLDPKLYNLKIMNAGLVTFWRHAESLYGPMTAEGHSNGGMQLHAANSRHRAKGSERGPQAFTKGFIKPLKIILDGRPPHFQLQNRRLANFVLTAQKAKEISEAFERLVISRVPLALTRSMLRSSLQTLTQGFTWALELTDFEKNGPYILEKIRGYRYMGGQVPRSSTRYNALTKTIMTQFATRFPLALATSVTPVGIDLDFLEHLVRQKDYEWGDQKLTSDTLVIVGENDPIGARDVMANALEIGSEVGLVRAVIEGAGHISELYEDYVKPRLDVEEAFLDGHLEDNSNEEPLRIKAQEPKDLLSWAITAPARFAVMLCDSLLEIAVPGIY